MCDSEFIYLGRTIQSAAIDGLQRWKGDDYPYETARTRLGYNLSEILLGVTSSRGGDWIWEESECFRFAEVDYMDSYGGYHDDMSGVDWILQQRSRLERKR